MMERRRCRRIAPPHPLQARIKSKEHALVVDLTPYGTLLEASLPLAPRSEYRLALSVDGGELRLRGVVRRCRVGMGSFDQGLVFVAGVEFVPMEKDLQQSLEDVLVDFPNGYRKKRINEVGIGLDYTGQLFDAAVIRNRLLCRHVCANADHLAALMCSLGRLRQ